MALAEIAPAAAAPDAPHRILPGEQLRTFGGSFKSEVLQEHHGSEVDNGQSKKLDGAADPGYNIPVLASYDGSMGFDSRNVYTGMFAENGYYPPGYEFSHQSPYCPQPQGPYVSSMGTGASGYGGPQYGTYYQPSLMQYYSAEPEGSKPLSKKTNAKDANQNAKGKPGVQGKPGYQAGYKTSVPPDAPNHWGLYPAAANGGFYGSAMGYELYSQQWTSSQRGFQPLPAPQNLGVHGNCVPPLPGGGPGRYQNFPRVHSTPNMTGRVFKGCTAKGGSAVSNWRAKEAVKVLSKGEVHANGVLTDIDQTQKPFVVKPKVLSSAVQECGDMLQQPLTIVDNQSISVSRSDYNKEDFQMSYEAAKFFIIKSYSEDDVHKSIKYSVWSSTPNGNKRLDDAYRKAQENPESPSGSCPVFFFFSVNSSGQFCGVAEMVGPVDFGKNMDFWLQGKWNGCLPVKWHIIKDVPNGHFRHIILSNNENKPVTHSRDTQEVHFHQGLEMLKIFKFFPTRTSLLDDFAFYDGRQRVLQERKSRQQLRQQVVKQIKEKINSERDTPSDAGKENGRPTKPAEKITTEADVLSNQTNENSTLTEAVEGEKSIVESVLQKVEELKVDVKTDPSKAAEICEKEKSRDVLESVCRPEEEKNSKPKGSEILANGTGKEGSGKPEVTETLGNDKSSKPKVASAETLTSAGKEDASRIVVNYKKALLEGIPGKVIVLDQTIGA